MASFPPNVRYSYLLVPNGKSMEQLVAEIEGVCGGADQARVMNALIKSLVNTYNQMDAAGDERSLIHLRGTLQRFHVAVENRLVEYALARANPAPPPLGPDDPLPGEVPPALLN